MATLVEIVQGIHVLALNITNTVVVSGHRYRTQILHLIGIYFRHASPETWFQLQLHYRFDNAVAMFFNSNHFCTTNVAIHVCSKTIISWNKVVCCRAAIDARAIHSLSEVPVGIHLGGPARHQTLTRVEAVFTGVVISPKTAHAHGYRLQPGFALRFTLLTIPVPTNRRTGRQYESQKRNCYPANGHYLVSRIRFS